MRISATTAQYHGTSFSVEVLKRILTVLSENGNMKRTSLAGRTGLNYIVCLKYINFMKMLGWIEVAKDGGENDCISITHVGRQVAAAIHDFLAGSVISPVDYSAGAYSREPGSGSTTVAPSLSSHKKR